MAIETFRLNAAGAFRYFFLGKVWKKEENDRYSLSKTQRKIINPRGKWNAESNSGLGKKGRKWGETAWHSSNQSIIWSNKLNEQITQLDTQGPVTNQSINQPINQSINQSINPLNISPTENISSQVIFKRSTFAKLSKYCIINIFINLYVFYFIKVFQNEENVWNKSLKATYHFRKTKASREEAKLFFVLHSHRKAAHAAE